MSMLEQDHQSQSCQKAATCQHMPEGKDSTSTEKLKEMIEILKEEKDKLQEENDKLIEEKEKLADKVLKLEEDLSAERESRSRLQDEKELLAQQHAGSADKLKHDLASPAPSSAWTLPPYMQDKLNALFDSQQSKQEHQPPTPASELGLELGLSDTVLRDLADKAGSLEEYARLVAREWELASKQEALGRAEVQRRMAEEIPGGSWDSPLSEGC
eukprot:764044-Hanusia_phi.AAC.2